MIRVLRFFSFHTVSEFISVHQCPSVANFAFHPWPSSRGPPSVAIICVARRSVADSLRHLWPSSAFLTICGSLFSVIRGLQLWLILYFLCGLQLWLVLSEFTCDMADLGPLWLSLRVATTATILIVAIGLPLALGLVRLRFPGKGLFAGILVLPLVLPPTVLGYLLLQVLSRRSALGAWLEQSLGIVLVFHWTGAVVASAVSAFPLFLLPARGPSRPSIPLWKTWPGSWAARSFRSSGV